MALNIVPLSISYEYEPCDSRKARELLISRTQKYVKGPTEDMHSILVGIRQRKGNIHMNIGKPLTEEEIDRASRCDKNDRYQVIRHIVDERVREGYHLWNTNFIAYDRLAGDTKYADRYQKEDVEFFDYLMDHRLGKLESSLNRDDLNEIFLRIYANPVRAKEEMGLLP